jgi:hypothetical protein
MLRYATLCDAKAKAKPVAAGQRSMSSFFGKK